MMGASLLSCRACSLTTWASSVPLRCQAGRDTTAAARIDKDSFIDTPRLWGQLGTPSSLHQGHDAEAGRPGTSERKLGNLDAVGERLRNFGIMSGLTKGIAGKDCGEDVVGDVSIAFRGTGIEPMRCSHRTNEAVGSDLGDRATSGADRIGGSIGLCSSQRSPMAATMRPCWASGPLPGPRWDLAMAGEWVEVVCVGENHGPLAPSPLLIWFCLQLPPPRVLSRAGCGFSHPPPALPPQTPLPPWQGRALDWVTQFELMTRAGWPGLRRGILMNMLEGARPSPFAPVVRNWMPPEPPSRSTLHSSRNLATQPPPFLQRQTLHQRHSMSCPVVPGTWHVEVEFVPFLLILLNTILGAKTLGCQMRMPSFLSFPEKKRSAINLYQLLRYHP